MKQWIALFLYLAVTTSPAYGFEGPTAALGKTLFESESFGTSGKSCSTCHPKGEGLEDFSRLDDDALARTINGCIRGPLKGKPLDVDSTEMKSLIFYLRSL